MIPAKPLLRALLAIAAVCSVIPMASGQSARFDKTSGELQLSGVSVGATHYTDVRLAIRQFSEVSTGVIDTGETTYDPVTRRLSISHLALDGEIFAGISVRLDDFSVIRATPAGSVASLNNGLLVHFPFDGALENKGSLALRPRVAPQTPVYVAGPVGQAYRMVTPPAFSGNVSHFIWDAPGELDGREISVAMWLYIGTDSGSPVNIFGVEDENAYLRNGATYDATTANFAVGYGREFKNGTLSGARLYFVESVGLPETAGGCCVGQRTFPSAGPQISQGRWVHVAFTRDRAKNRVRVWYDGVEGAGSQASISVYRPFATGAAMFLGRPSWIQRNGAFESTPEKNFFGALAVDDLRIYGRILYPEEIAMLAAMRQ